MKRKRRNKKKNEGFKVYIVSRLSLKTRWRSGSVARGVWRGAYLRPGYLVSNLCDSSGDDLLVTIWYRCIDCATATGLPNVA